MMDCLSLSNTVLSLDLARQLIAFSLNRLQYLVLSRVIEPDYDLRIKCTCDLDTDKLELFIESGFVSDFYDFRFLLQNNTQIQKRIAESNACMNKAEYEEISKVVHQNIVTVQTILAWILGTIGIHNGQFNGSLCKLIVKFMYNARIFQIYEMFNKLIVDPNCILGAPYLNDDERTEYIKMYLSITEPHPELLKTISTKYPDSWRSIIKDDTIVKAPFYRLLSL
jgi:hypothetical protein